MPDPFSVDEPPAASDGLHRNLFNRRTVLAAMLSAAGALASASCISTGASHNADASRPEVRASKNLLRLRIAVTVGQAGPHPTLSRGLCK